MSNKYEYWFWENCFNKKEIIKINQFIEKNIGAPELEKYGAKDKEGLLKKSSFVRNISWKKIKNLIQEVYVNAMDSARTNFGYDVYDVSDSKDALFNIYSYKNKSKYDWHVDCDSSELYDVKLTVLINLSLNEYEGGDFKLFNQNEIIVKELKKPGNVIMFKSKLNHCVTPVTKGERRTLTIFICGPKFR